MNMIEFKWHQVVLSKALLSLLFVLTTNPSPVQAATETTEFSKQVTAAFPDWRAQKVRRGTIRLHPQQFNEFADVFLRLFPEEMAFGRAPLVVLKSHFAGASYSPNSGDKAVQLDKLEETAPGLFSVTHRWTEGFSSMLGFWGVVKTVNDTYIPFNAQCRREKPKYDGNYTEDGCIKSVVTALILLQTQKLKIPEPAFPIEVAGYTSQYSNSGLSIANNGSDNGIRKVVLYVTPPRNIPADQLPAALQQFSDSIIHDDDYAHKHPGVTRSVGSPTDPWLRREFPQAMEGPSIQMVGTQATPDGKIALIGIRCPNEGWTGTCSYGVEQAKLQIKSGQMETRRQKILAAQVIPIPANGIKTSQVLAIYGMHKVNGINPYFDANLFLKDGTVTGNTSKAPIYLDPAAERKKEPGSWGRWRRSGTDMIVTWDDGQTEKIAATNENMQVGGQPGLKLNGTFGSISSGSTGIGSGWVSRNYYTFFPDGTFKNDRSNSFAVSAYLPNGNALPTQVASGASNASNKARYEIDGYTISFIYPDGQIERKSFAVWAKDAGKPSPAQVFIGGSSVTLNLEGR
jgi:hypothetical protein